jgi:hypothetical protein
MATELVARLATGHRNKSDGTSALDGDGERPLVTGAGSVSSTRFEFAMVADIPA